MGKKVVIYITKKSMKMALVLITLFIYFALTAGLEIPAFNTDSHSLALVQVILMGLALGTDAFSLSIGIGMTKICLYKITQISCLIGFFHVVMPLIGVLLGELLGTALGEYGKYVGSFLIVIIGINMIYETRKGKKDVFNIKLTGWSLIILAFSVSIDALTVGFGLGTVGFPLYLVVGIFGLLGGIMTAIGLTFGWFIGEWFGERSEFFGGLVLILLGIKMVVF
ncbi:manganese efflux pump MntP family protein [Anaerobranca gottschalkii]|uniref:Putative manganese efflux pump MntP n=1 Tax=Anaerobranca gottschalkii DSM 13577 TaxID=1120990 RepID=A0A1I0BLQ3_9FIRM|nr:manganese efflux pump MntP family protein [Anaerobranca gottschalkii]SET07594.1 Putative Mn2+ efflux pump MntP [Anaerobranca gottschalkii DSM 13577]